MSKKFDFVGVTRLQNAFQKLTSGRINLEESVNDERLMNDLEVKMKMKVKVKIYLVGVFSDYITWNISANTRGKTGKNSVAQTIGYYNG